MADSITAEQFLDCGRCGNPYRPSRWGREYLCPACGQPLQAQAAPARRAPSGWLIYGAAVVLLAGVAVRGVEDRLRAPRDSRTEARQRVEASPAILPPDFEQRLREKAALLTQDLELAPGHPVLRVELAHTYLGLAVLQREKEPERSRRLMADARALLDGTETKDAVLARNALIFRDLADAASGAGSLIWIEHRAPDLSYSALADVLQSRASLQGGGSGFISNSMLGGAGALANRPSGNRPPRAELYPGGANSPYSGGGNGVYSGSGPYSGGANGLYSGGGNGPYSEGGNGNDPRSDGPDGNRPGGNGPRSGGPYSNRPEASTLTRPAAASVPLPIGGRRIDALEQTARANPTDLGAWCDFAGALEERAALLSRAPGSQGGPRAEPVVADRKRAMQAYQAAAEHARARIHKYGFYVAAARLADQVQDRPSEYRCLKRAADSAPYIASTWQELQEACVRTGRIAESYEVRKQLEAWTLPSLRRRTGNDRA